MCPQICFISGVCKISIFICICTKSNNCISDLEVTKAKKLIKLGADDFYKIQISIFYFISEFPDFPTLQIFNHFLMYQIRSTIVSFGNISGHFKLQVSSSIGNSARIRDILTSSVKFFGFLPPKKRKN